MFHAAFPVSGYCMNMTQRVLLILFKSVLSRSASCSVLTFSQSSSERFAVISYALR